MEDKNKDIGDNILEELAGEIDFGENGTDSDLKKPEIKDINYYIQKINTPLKFVNIFGVIVLILFFSYIKIQNLESRTNLPGMDMICNLFLGESSDSITGECGSVKSLLNEYTKEKEAVVTSQFKSIVENLQRAYSVDHFNSSEKVSFLLDKTKNRLKPIEILEAFDDLKNFYVIGKDEIDCSNISISDENIIKMNCYAYTPSYNNKIRNPDSSSSGSTKAGTSLSLASSFISFIDKNTNFEIISKQKVFTIENTVVPGFAKRTPFSLELKYLGKKLESL